MTDLPRYSMMFTTRDLVDVSGADIVPVQHLDGDWVKWGDVSARLQQLDELERMLAEAVEEADDLTRRREREAVRADQAEAKVQQLAQEKARLQESCDSHADHAEEHFRNWERLVIRVAELKEEKAARNLKAIEGEAENTSLRAALAETREALHQLQARAEAKRP